MDKEITTEEADVKIYSHKIMIAEILRDMFTEYAINGSDDMKKWWIFHRAGQCGIEMNTIVCPRVEFERRKSSGEL